MTGRTNSVRKLRTVHGKADKLVAGREYGQERYRAAGAKIKTFGQFSCPFPVNGLCSR